MSWRDPTAPSTTAAHETTTRHAGAFYPLLHDVGRHVPGVLIGQDLLGGLFSYDPFELYSAGLLTNPNAVVFGQIGRGKSSLVKTYLLRQMAFGRQAFVLDPKGEYAALSRSVGLEPLRLEPGGSLRLNPLELVAGEGDGRARQLQLLEALVSSSAGALLGPRQRAAMELALDEATERAAVATIPDVVAALLAPSARSASLLRTSLPELAEDGRDVGLELRRLVTGDLAGLFDGPSSVPVSPLPALVVIDLSALYGSPALSLLMLCASAWLQGALRASTRQGRQVLLVLDEAWAVLSDLAVARWMQASWKLARAWGAANMAVLHRASDLTAVGPQGSEQRRLAEGLLLDSETRILYAQPAGEVEEAAELLELTAVERDLLGRLGRGVALWKVGGHSSLVRHLVSSSERPLIDTDAAMGER